MRRLLTVLLVSWSVSAHAGVPDLGLSGTPAAAERLNKSWDEIYAREIARYDALLQQRPFDVALAVERCRFMGEMMSDDTGRYEQAESDHEKCGQELESRFADHPEVVLYQLDWARGTEDIQRAESLIGWRTQVGWSNAQAARLHAYLARTYDARSDGTLAKYHALQALQYDAGADTRLIAARWQLRDGERKAAIAVLTSPLDSGEPDAWQLAQRLELLAQAGGRDEVRQLYQTMQQVSPHYDAFAAAKSLAAAGAITEARKEFEKAATDTWRGPMVALDRFRFELTNGSAEQARAAYEHMRDLGFGQDPMLHYRFALALRHPTLPLRARDLAGAVTAIGTVALFALLALLLLVPVHYRGLARRLAGAAPHEYSQGWHLPQAWYALFAFLLGNLAALYCVGPLAADQSGLSLFWVPALEDNNELARVTLTIEALVALFLLPLALTARRRGFSWTLHWSLTKAIGVGITTAIALRIPLLILVLVFGPRLPNMHQWLGSQPEILATADAFGMPMAFILTALAAPVIEEFLFRGVLLRVFSRHLSFGWANFYQATLFALIHVDLRIMPAALVLGLIAGTLARRSGGLLAPMLLHATFNGILMTIVALH
ncbi:MAG TPA: type II CAAX endopeptidase family protein [Steroidobacteraceae bacterium]|nr:type II CAAX endopeptidase family protein [Steroidobacteraceae bacterium]